VTQVPRARRALPTPRAFLPITTLLATGFSIVAFAALLT
jgi:hypothetical protein